MLEKDEEKEEEEECFICRNDADKTLFSECPHCTFRTCRSCTLAYANTQPQHFWISHNNMYYQIYKCMICKRLINSPIPVKPYVPYLQCLQCCFPWYVNDDYEYI